GVVFFFQAEDGIRDFHVTGVQTCALPIFRLYDDVVHDVKDRTRKRQRRRDCNAYKHVTDLADNVEGENLPDIEVRGGAENAGNQIGRASCRERGWGSTITDTFQMNALRAR